MLFLERQPSDVSLSYGTRNDAFPAHLLQTNEPSFHVLVEAGLASALESTHLFDGEVARTQVGL